jgi:hypothetical protein
LVLVSVSVNAQTTNVLTKTTPVSDTIILNAPAMDSVAIEVVDLVKLYSTIEVEVEMNQRESVAKKLVGMFGVEYNHTENSKGVKVTNVSPRKAEIFATINGNDLQYKRTIKIVVPPNTYVKVNRMSNK